MYTTVVFHDGGGGAWFTVPIRSEQAKVITRLSEDHNNAEDTLALACELDGRRGGWPEVRRVLETNEALPEALQDQEHAQRTVTTLLSYEKNRGIRGWLANLFR